MKDNKLTYEQVWKTLRAVDLSKLEYSKQGLTYIAWADIWATLCSIYPNATYDFKPPVFYGAEGSTTCEVSCVINIGELSREMSLPVMTSALPMKSIINPTSRDINDAQMRCFVKAVAMFGLGLYLWEKKTTKTNNKKVKAFSGKPF